MFLFLAYKIVFWDFQMTFPWILNFPSFTNIHIYKWLPKGATTRQNRFHPLIPFSLKHWKRSQKCGWTSDIFEILWRSEKSIMNFGWNITSSCHFHCLNKKEHMDQTLFPLMSNRMLPDCMGEDLDLQCVDIEMETKSFIWWDLDTSFSQIASYSFI